MNNEVYEELKKLMNCFPDAFINRQLEFILIPKQTLTSAWKAV